MNKTDWINVSAVAVLTAAEFVLLISVALFVASFIENNTSSGAGVWSFLGLLVSIILRVFRRVFLKRRLRNIGSNKRSRKKYDRY